MDYKGEYKNETPRELFIKNKSKPNHVCKGSLKFIYKFVENRLKHLFLSFTHIYTVN